MTSEQIRREAEKDAEIERLRTALMYFLSEDWSHITDPEILREIAEEVALKDKGKWDILNLELASKDAEIEALETVLSAGQMAICEQNAEIERWKTADSEAVKALRAEIVKLRGTLESAWWQFAYVDGNGKRWCGGLSALEDIADVLELDV